jgi:hypothetical protein
LYFKSYLEKTHHKKGLAEWLKVWALSSNPSTPLKRKVENCPLAHRGRHTENEDTQEEDSHGTGMMCPQTRDCHGLHANTRISKRQERILP